MSTRPALWLLATTLACAPSAPEPLDLPVTPPQAPLPSPSDLEPMVWASVEGRAAERLALPDPLHEQTRVTPAEDAPVTGWALQKRPVRGSRIREFVYAPAPSRLSFDATVPEAGHLDVALSMLRTPQRTTGAVTFEVLVERDGEVEQVYEKRVPHSTRTWIDPSIDLSTYAGHDVRIHLVTTAHRKPEAQNEALDAADLPIWSMPRLRTAEQTGKTLVLVVIDTLGNWVTTFGNPERNTTPNLARIAAQGTHYAQAYSSASWTLPAVASMLTGRTPAEHGAGSRDPTHATGRRPLSRDAHTLAEHLRAAGWDTRAWVNNPFLTSHFGISQGFEVFVDYATPSSPASSAPAVREAIDWLSTPNASDRFVLLHLMEPHGRYRPTRGALEYLDAGKLIRRYPRGQTQKMFLEATKGETPEDVRRDTKVLYEATVYDADVAVGRVFKALSARLPKDSWRMVITSDHGEELWQHGFYEHGHHMLNEVVHVPWIEAPTPPQRIDEPRTTRDIFHHAMAFAGLSAPLETPSPVVGSSTLYGPTRAFTVQDDHKLVSNLRLGEGGRAPATVTFASLYNLRDETDDLTKAEAPPPQARAAWQSGHEQLIDEALGSMAGHLVFVRPRHPDGGMQTLGLRREPVDTAWPRRYRVWSWPDDQLSTGRGKVAWRAPDGVQAKLQTLGGVIAFEAPQVRVPSTWTLSASPDAPPIDIEVPVDQQLTRDQIVEALAQPGDDWLVGWLPPYVASEQQGSAPLADELRALGYVQ